MIIDLLIKLFIVKEQNNFIPLKIGVDKEGRGDSFFSL